MYSPIGAFAGGVIFRRRSPFAEEDFFFRLTFHITFDNNDWFGGMRKTKDVPRSLEGFEPVERREVEHHGPMVYT